MFFSVEWPNASGLDENRLIARRADGDDGQLRISQLGDREAAEFFAKMAAAGYSERERGHTGNFFNMLWAMQGVARCGPLTSGAYLQEQAWYYDLARSWDTRFIYQGSPVGEEEHGAYLRLLMLAWVAPECRLPNDDAWLARRLSRPIETIQRLEREDLLPYNDTMELEAMALTRDQAPKRGLPR